GAYLPPLAIDPLMVNKVSSSDYSKIDTFPANAGTSYPAMKRLTVLTTCNVSGSGPTPTITPNYPLSEAIFRAADDIVSLQPDDRSAPATGQFTLDSSGNAVKRDFEGGYTWMATLTPYYPDLMSVQPQPGNLFTLSIVIFYRRVLSTPAVG